MITSYKYFSKGFLNCKSLGLRAPNETSFLFLIMNMIMINILLPTKTISPSCHESVKGTTANKTDIDNMFPPQSLRPLFPLETFVLGFITSNIKIF